MKSKSLILTLVFAFCASFALVTPAKSAETTPAKPTVAQVVQAVAVNNQVCPVCAKKLEVGQGSVCNHNGKAYRVCSKTCGKAFKKDAAKYSKIADDEVAAATATAGPKA